MKLTIEYKEQVIEHTGKKAVIKVNLFDMPTEYTKVWANRDPDLAMWKIRFYKYPNLANELLTQDVQCKLDAKYPHWRHPYGQINLPSGLGPVSKCSMTTAIKISEDNYDEFVSEYIRDPDDEIIDYQKEHEEFADLTTNIIHDKVHAMICYCEYTIAKAEALATQI